MQQQASDNVEIRATVVPTIQDAKVMSDVEETSAVEVSAESSPLVAHRRKMLAGAVATLLGGALWGCNGTLVSFLLTHYNVDSMWLVCVRELGASVLFLATAALTNRENLVGIMRSRSAMKMLLITAFTSILFSNICYVETISWTNSATATVLQSLSVIMVMVWVCYSTHRRPRKRELVAAALALAGTYLLATGGDPSTLALPPAGLAWGMGAALSAALLAIVPVDILNRWGSFVVNGLAMLISGVALSAFMAPWAHMPALDTLGWVLVGCAIVFGTFGSYALYLHGIKVVGSVKGAMLSTSEPLMAMLSSVLVMGTAFTPTDLVAFTMILVMVYLAA